MSLLSEHDVTDMRSALNLSLPGTAVIKTSTFVDNQGGGGTTTFAAAGTVSCRLAPLTGTERETADRISEESDWMVTLPALTTIDVDDRIVSSGGTFAVTAVRAPRSYEVSRRVECRKLT